jgi:hypothetical protein
MKYRKKPVIVEAEQFFIDKKPWPKGVSEIAVPNEEEVTNFGFATAAFTGVEHGVTTIHGQWTKVVDGDWILPEPDGEHFYPCKPEIFAATYEPIGE